MIARLGDYDLETDPDCDGDGMCNPKVIKSEIAEIKVHFRYRHKQNDIALLKLKNTLPENYYDHIEPICVPQSDDFMQDLFINRNVSVTGWGGTGTGNFSNKVKLFSQPIANISF